MSNKPSGDGFDDVEPTVTTNVANVDFGTSTETNVKAAFKAEDLTTTLTEVKFENAGSKNVLLPIAAGQVDDNTATKVGDGYKSLIVQCTNGANLEFANTDNVDFEADGTIKINKENAAPTDVLSFGSLKSSTTDPDTEVKINSNNPIKFAKSEIYQKRTIEGLSNTNKPDFTEIDIQQGGELIAKNIKLNKVIFNKESQIDLQSGDNDLTAAQFIIPIGDTPPTNPPVTLASTTTTDTLSNNFITLQDLKTTKVKIAKIVGSNQPQPLKLLEDPPALSDAHKVCTALQDKIVDKENMDLECTDNADGSSDLSAATKSSSGGDNQPDEPSNDGNENKGGDDDDDGLSAGAIAGIVIACIVVVAAIIALLVYFLVIKKKKEATTSTQGDSSIAI